MAPPTPSRESARGIGWFVGWPYARPDEDGSVRFGAGPSHTLVSLGAADGTPRPSFRAFAFLAPTAGWGHNAESGLRSAFRADGGNGLRRGAVSEARGAGIGRPVTGDDYCLGRGVRAGEMRQGSADGPAAGGTKLPPCVFDFALALLAEGDLFV